MSPYFFIGSDCSIGDSIELKRLGQKVQLSDEAVANAVIGGAALLPEDKFSAVGFTSDELNDYAFIGQRASAPDEFNAKMLAARNALHEFRIDLVAQAHVNGTN